MAVAQVTIKPCKCIQLLNFVMQLSFRIHIRRAQEKQVSTFRWQSLKNKYQNGLAVELNRKAVHSATGWFNLIARNRVDCLSQ